MLTEQERALSLPSEWISDANVGLSSTSDGPALRQRRTRKVVGSSRLCTLLRASRPLFLSLWFACDIMTHPRRFSTPKTQRLYLTPETVPKTNDALDGSLRR